MRSDRVSLAAFQKRSSVNKPPVSVASLISRQHLGTTPRAGSLATGCTVRQRPSTLQPEVNMTSYQNATCKLGAGAGLSVSAEPVTVRPSNESRSVPVAARMRQLFALRVPTPGPPPPPPLRQSVPHQGHLVQPKPPLKPSSSPYLPIDAIPKPPPLIEPACAPRHRRGYTDQAKALFSSRAEMLAGLGARAPSVSRWGTIESSDGWVETAARDATTWTTRNRLQTLEAITESPCSARDASRRHFAELIEPP